MKYRNINTIEIYKRISISLIYMNIVYASFTFKIQRINFWWGTTTRVAAAVSSLHVQTFWENSSLQFLMVLSHVWMYLPQKIFMIMRRGYHLLMITLGRSNQMNVSWLELIKNNDYLSRTTISSNSDKWLYKVCKNFRIWGTKMFVIFEQLKVFQPIHTHGSKVPRSIADICLKINLG